MFSQFEAAEAIYESNSSPAVYETTLTMEPSFAPPTLYVNGALENGGTISPGARAHHDEHHGRHLLYDQRHRSAGQRRRDRHQHGGRPDTGPITLAQGETIEARVLSGSTWSALNNSTFYVDLTEDVRVTELMYSPAAPTAAEIAAGYTDAQEFEFVELQNIGTNIVPLQGLTFTNGVTFTFPDVSLAAGAYIVVASDPDAFAFRYGSTILTSEYGTGGLSTISSITCSDTTATVTLNNTSNGFQDGEYIDIGGAAQSQYDGDFAISNVTVSAGTTTFTYTVSGAPRRPRRRFPGSR